MSKSARMLLASLCAIAMAASAALAQGPIDWPGAGSADDWSAACRVNEQANDALKDEFDIATMKPNRQVVNKAIVLFQKAINKYPYETAFYDGLGKCYLDLGDDKKAEATYRKSVEVKEKYKGPQNKIRYADTYLALAKLCDKNYEVHDADVNYKKACELWGMADCYKEYAAFLKRQKRLKESAAMLKKVDDMQKEYDKRPKTPGAWRPPSR